MDKPVRSGRWWYCCLVLLQVGCSCDFDTLLSSRGNEIISVGPQHASSSFSMAFSGDGVGKVQVVLWQLNLVYGNGSLKTKRNVLMVHFQGLGVLVCLGSRLREDVPAFKWVVRTLPARCTSLMESNESFGMDGALRLRRLEREIRCLRQKV